MTGSNQQTSQVYDLPTRLFHWIFAVLFLGAFLIAKNVDDESPIFANHMLMGLSLAFISVLRVVWGLVGSRYARFASFSLRPQDLRDYFFGILSGKGKRHLGHNPASSWATLAMLGLAFGLAFTGVQMAQGNKEAYEDIHELFANGFILIVLAHIAGVVLHTIRFRDAIGLSMVTGRKQSVVGEPQEVGIGNQHSVVAIVFLALLAAFVFNLKSNFDPTTRVLNLFGTTLQLGEAEEEEGPEAGPEGDESAGKESAPGNDQEGQHEGEPDRDGDDD